MATIKAYTDLEQSKKLAEILPLESADMKWYFWKSEIDAPKTPTFGYSKTAAESYKNTEAIYLACWSLTALFNILPKYIGDYSKCLCYDAGRYYCGYMDDGDFMLTIEKTNADNPIDACVEMIIKLHEKNLL